jgi:type I site-specific restriction-modification system R (restriction) subunit
MPDDPALSLLGDSAPLGDPDENLFEETTVERLKELGYEHYLGNDLRGEDFPETQVVHRPTLRAFLKAQYPQLDETALRQAVQHIASPDGVDVLQRNKHLHELVTQGFELAYERADGTEAYAHIYPIDWPETLAARAQAVQQVVTSAEEPLTAEEVAQRFRYGRRKQIEQLLDTLHTLGLVRAAGEGRFAG